MGLAGAGSSSSSSRYTNHISCQAPCNFLSFSFLRDMLGVAKIHRRNFLIPHVFCRILIPATRIWWFYGTDVKPTPHAYNHRPQDSASDFVVYPSVKKCSRYSTTRRHANTGPERADKYEKNKNEPSSHHEQQAHPPETAMLWITTTQHKRNPRSKRTLENKEPRTCYFSLWLLSTVVSQTRINKSVHHRIAQDSTTNELLHVISRFTTQYCFFDPREKRWRKLTK